MWMKKRCCDGYDDDAAEQKKSEGIFFLLSFQGVFLVCKK
jgi:hypothetical protein